MRPVTRRRDLSGIAYGFMASRALFAALELRLFTHLAHGPCTADALAAAVGVPVHRATTLLRALTALGLVVRGGDGYVNAPASARYLVRGTPDDFGEYFRLQVGRQIYPALAHLDAGIAGTGTAFDALGGLLAEPDAACTFTTAQHAGSLAAARVLADRLPLADARRLLDVGGGSGAFAIALCERHPLLRATVLDFATVLDVTATYVREAGLGARIALLDADATDDGWPADQDVVLLSYLLSAVRGSEIDTVLAAAHASMRPGGMLVVHDFVLDDDGTGPAVAALWFLQYLAYQPDAVSFTEADLRARLAAAGFAVTPAEVLIPEITKVVLARKETRS